MIFIYFISIIFWNMYIFTYVFAYFAKPSHSISNLTMLPTSDLPKTIFIFIISLLASFTFLPVFILCILLPCWIIRSIAIATARFCPDLYAPLSPDSCLTVVDALYTAPRCSLVSIHYIKGPLPYSKLRERIGELVESEKFPPLRCHLSRWLATYFWKRCTSTINPFLLDNHLSQSDISTEAEFRTFVESLVSKPYVKGRPLWEIVAFPSYTDKKIGTSSVLVIRVHHSLTDGFGLVTLLKAIEDPNTDIEDGLKKLKAKYKSQLSESLGLGFYLKLFLVTPTHTLFTILNNHNSNPWTIPVSKMSGELVFYENTAELDLEWVKDIGKRRGHKFTTVLLEGVTAAIRSTLLEQGHKIDGNLSIAWAWPKPGHPGTLTNHAFCVPIVAPISIPDREARLNFISREFKKWHRSPLALGMMAACSGFGMLQGMLNFPAKSGHYCTLILSNFLFFPKIGTLFGSEITQLDALSGLQVPEISLMLGAGGYNGKLNLSVKADKDIFQDKKAAQRFTQLVVEEFESLDRDAGPVVKIV